MPLIVSANAEGGPTNFIRKFLPLAHHNGCSDVLYMFCLIHGTGHINRVD
jgi:hypothetical protein